MILDDIQYMRAINSIKKGGKGNISYAMICNASINLVDAKKNLTPEDYLKVKSIYDQFMLCKTKFKVDIDGWWKLTREVIDKFDDVAPYEKYFGGNEFEMHMLQQSRKREELATASNKEVEYDERELSYIEHIIENGRSAKITHEEAVVIFEIIKIGCDQGKEAAIYQAAKFSTVLKGKYSIEWWGIKMAYLYGTLKANDIISSSELELFNQKIDEQMINNS